MPNRPRPPDPATDCYIQGTVHLADVADYNPARGYTAPKVRPVVIWRDTGGAKVEVVGLTTVPHHFDGTPRLPIRCWALACLQAEAWVWHHGTTRIPRPLMGRRIGILEPCDLAAIAHHIGATP